MSFEIRACQASGGVLATPWSIRLLCLRAVSFCLCRLVCRPVVGNAFRGRANNSKIEKSIETRKYRARVSCLPWPVRTFGRLWFMPRSRVSRRTNQPTKIA